METTDYKKYLDANIYEYKIHYSKLGWFLITFIGMSAKPIQIDVYERSTSKLIASITDDEFLTKFIGR
mgnify:CR=1 FL=1